MLRPKVFSPELKEELRLELDTRLEAERLVEVVLEGLESPMMKRNTESSVMSKCHLFLQRALPPFFLVSCACAMILLARCGLK